MILIQLGSLFQITLSMLLIAQAIETKGKHVVAMYLIREIQITLPNLQIR